MPNNQEIRKTAKTRGVRLWQVGERLGMSDANFSRMLRHELPQEKQKEILRIINHLSKQTA